MLSTKFIKKYMRLAKQIGEDQNPCYSRNIGVVIVDPIRNKILSTGYNGPPRGTPHCDSHEYLKDFFLPQLSETDKIKAYDYFGINPFNKTWQDRNCPKDTFLNKATNCQTCPRRLIGAKSGERLELCSCEHAERNAVYNAVDDLHGSMAFCWCGVPCQDCTKALIQSGVKYVYCLFVEPDYSPGSRWLFKKANVELIIDKAENYLS